MESTENARALKLDGLRKVESVTRVLSDLLKIGETLIVGDLRVTRHGGTRVITRERVLLSLDDCAAAWGLKSATGLRAQIGRQALAAEKMGGRWFVTREEADRYKRESVGRRGRKPKVVAVRPPTAIASDDARLLELVPGEERDARVLRLTRDDLVRWCEMNRHLLG